MGICQGQAADLAFGLRLQLPSPSEDEFAGPNSWALDPRLIGQIRVSDQVSVLLDLAYLNDFTFDELSSFQWSVGAAYGVEDMTVDAGFAGSAFREGAEWTPREVVGGGFGPGSLLFTAIEDNRVGTFYANFVGGAKYEFASGQIVSVAINVPVNGDVGIRPDAVVTAAYELYF